ncbi:MAG TPA: hypothetical protein VJH71_02590 [Candidatus Paceibacterota bacterium]
MIEIAEFIVNEEYLDPFRKFFKRALAFGDLDCHCTVLDYIFQPGLEVQVTGKHNVGPRITEEHPIDQILDFFQFSPEAETRISNSPYAKRLAKLLT